MIVKALLAWAGLRAAPGFHDGRVHEALKADAAILSGVRIVARRSLAVACAIATEPDDAVGLSARVGELHQIMAEVARRAG